MRFPGLYLYHVDPLALLLPSNLRAKRRHGQTFLHSLEKHLDAPQIFRASCSCKHYKLLKDMFASEVKSSHRFQLWGTTISNSYCLLLVVNIPTLSLRRRHVRGECGQEEASHQRQGHLVPCLANNAYKSNSPFDKSGAQQAREYFHVPSSLFHTWPTVIRFTSSRFTWGERFWWHNMLAR